MKKLIALLLALVLALGMLAGCSKQESKPEETKGTETTDGSGEGQNTTQTVDLKVGVILVGDENESYTMSHIEGIQKAAEALNIPGENIIWKYSIPEDEACTDAAYDLIDSGCTLLISNSYGHGSYMEQVARDNPSITCIAMTGDTAAISGLPNFKNAFTYCFEARYVSGVVAGMKLKQMMDEGIVTDPHIGFVGAHPYAEVNSGYTAFFLGVQSIVPEAYMDVVFTGSWFDITAESVAADALIARGCCIISGHADSIGAPSACEAALNAGTPVYNVGYNLDMRAVAPHAALTSAQNNWVVYYTYALGQALKGEEIATDWAAGYAEGAVQISELGESCAPGTAEKVEEVIGAIKDGTLHVFSTDKFTVNGEHLTSCIVDLTGDFDTDDAGDKEAIWDGYFHESELRAAPSFCLDIDGITKLSN